MKKSLLFLFLLLFGVCVTLWVLKAPLLSSYLSNKLRLPISIGKISITSHQSQIRDFVIQNPSRFQTPTAFAAVFTEIDYQWRQLFANPTVIEKIEMSDIFLGVEMQGGSSNNWTVISERMPRQKSEREVLIRKLILNNLRVEVRGLTAQPIVKKINRLELDNIDSAKGFPTEQLIRQIFGGLGIQEYIKNAFDPQKILQKAFNLRNFLGEKEGPSEESP